MTPLFRIALLVGALCVFALVLRKIRHAEVKIADSTFWFLFALCLVVLAVFPHIAFFFAGVFGIESPANFVFLCVMVVLIVREFYTTAELSQLRSKLTALVQENALLVAERRDARERATQAQRGQSSASGDPRKGDR